MRNTIITACLAFLLISNNVIAQNCSLTITGGNCTDSSLIAHVKNGSLATLTWYQYTNNVYGADTVSSQKSIAVVAGNHGGGAASNQFSNPPAGGIAVDAAGNIYVADVANSRIQKWAPGAIAGVTVAGGHGRGSASNQLASPTDVFVDDSGNVYVADLANFRIQKWAPGATSGITVAGGNGSGSSAKQFGGPRGLYVAKNGDIYIADTYNYRIQKWKAGATKGTTVAGGNGPGLNANQLSFPIDVYLDGAKNIYIADAFIEDASFHRVQKWAPGATSGVTVAGGNGEGSNANQFGFLLSIYVDAAGNVYATDNGVSGSPISRVQKWTVGASSGVTVAGGHNNGWDMLSYPTGVAVDKNGLIYVFDGVYNPRVQKYTPTNGIVDSTYHPIYASTYHAQAVFKNGCTATSNSLTIRSVPETPVIRPMNPEGRGNHCSGGSDSFFVSAWDDITDYTWKVPAQCNLISTRNDTVVIGFPANFTSGRLTVKGKNICGTSRPDTMVLLGRPISPTTIKGPRRVSPNQTGVNYSVTDLNSNHNWTVPPGAVIQSGQGSPSITVTWGSVAGTVSVNSYNDCGASPNKSIAVQLKNNFSGSEFVTGKSLNEMGASVFPNPAINNATVKFNSLTQTNYTLILQDITGAMIMEKNITAKQGLNSVTLDITKYARGTYLITIKNTKTKITARFIKQ